MLSQFYVDDIIRRALTEDINYVDVTTDYLIDDAAEGSAQYVAKESGVLAGVKIALRVFELLDDSVEYEILKNDGDSVEAGEIILTLKGRVKTLLKGERTSLNLIQHMSGIATMTNKCAKLIEGTGCTVADTRKTLPGLRALQKYAVSVGGGRNHRFNLSDGAMLKDNHIDAYGSMTKAVNALRGKIGHMVKIEVETRNFDELNEALASGADVIMLDNMSPEQMAEAVKTVNGRAKLEASGNITLDNIYEVAKSGVDIISLGALTHSVKAFDISMKIT